MTTKSPLRDRRQATSQSANLRPVTPEASRKTVRKATPAQDEAKGKAPPSASRKSVRKSPARPPVNKKAEEQKDREISKPKKVKLIRDSFTMPEPEYDLIATIKKRCMAKGLAAKKSEVLRAAIIAFAARSDTVIAGAVKALAVVKTGRPPKSK